MKLLFDANISRKIVPLLGDLFPESSHVTLIGFPGETRDDHIWAFARESGSVIVTADGDFIQLAEAHGPRRKLFGWREWTIRRWLRLI